jgi:hypothetical protein
MPLNAIPCGSNSASIAKACEAIDRVRLSRAATRHAIERSLKYLRETQAVLVALRHKCVLQQKPFLKIHRRTQ